MLAATFMSTAGFRLPLATPDRSSFSFPPGAWGRTAYHRQSCIARLPRRRGEGRLPGFPVSGSWKGRHRCRCPRHPFRIRPCPVDKRLRSFPSRTMSCCIRKRASPRLGSPVALVRLIILRRPSENDMPVRRGNFEKLTSSMKRPPSTLILLEGVKLFSFL